MINYNKILNKNLFNYTIWILIAFFLSMNTKEIIKDLKNLEDVIVFSNLDENHDSFSNKNREIIGKFEIETPKIIWIDEFICLSSKAPPFKCGDENEDKLKGVFKSQSKHINFEEYKKRLDGEDYQRECDTYILRSLTHETYLQKIKNLHYPYSMIKDLKSVILKICLGNRFKIWCNFDNFT